MDISDAFAVRNVREANVDLDTTEAAELDEHLAEIFSAQFTLISNALPEGGDIVEETKKLAVELAKASFVAGRCYEEQFASLETFPIDMPRQMLGDFIQFLHERASRG